MSSYRVTVDTGGTFSDFVYLNENTGELSIAKVPSTPDDPSRAILDGIEMLLTRGVRAAEIAYFCHGTTVGTNALLEGKGVRTGLLVTEGFRGIYPVGERHHGIERRRPRMIAHARPDPGRARLLRLRNRCLGGKAHDQMAHAVVAVDQRGRGLLSDEANVRALVDPVRLEAAHIKRQANDAVGVAAAQIGLDHESGNLRGIPGGKPGRLECAPDESGERIRGYAWSIQRICLIHCGCAPSRMVPFETS